MPGEVEGALAVGHADRQQLGLDCAEHVETAPQAGGVPDHADIIPHGVQQPLAQAVEVAALRANGSCALGSSAADRLVGLSPSRIGRDPGRHRLPGDAAEHGGVGDAVAAEPVGAVRAAGILARHE